MLSKPQQDGATTREHLESLWRQSGVKPPELEAPPLPPLAAHIWAWFCDLSGERGNNGMGPSRLTARNIMDWCEFTATTLALWERRALRALDDAWIKSL